MSKFQIAEINIARMKGVDINDPVMKEFVDNLDKVNSDAEKSEGFVWRLKDENNNATNFNPYDDEQILINISVWESIGALEKFMYHTFHSDFLRRRKEWFQVFGKAHTALWWVPSGQYPTMQEAVDNLAYLQQNGPSSKVFDLKNIFPVPV